MDELPSLAEAGRARGIEVGAAWFGTGPTSLRAILARQVAIVVPEWQLKPAHLRPDPAGPYRFADADAVYGFARDNGLAMHGHTLHWHGSPIPWADSADASSAMRAYGGFMRDVVARYPDLPSWDVLNEIVEERTLLRDTPMLAAHGLDFVDFCFRTAHEAAPHARLVLNDYNLSCADWWCGAKRGNMLRVLEALLARGTPVHAVGVQSHLSSRHLPDPEATRAFMDEIGAMGLDVYVSELDVNDIDFDDDIAARDVQAAALIEDYLDAVLECRSVRRLVLWGLFDAWHWLALGDWDGVRGAGARPALFDAQERPKPAFDAVLRALSRAPLRA